MHFRGILNRDGGTLRTLDLDAFGASMRTTLEDAGHKLDLHVVEGRSVVAALEAAVESDCDVVLVGGGDGTVSCAAGLLAETDKVLAILPAGTMNLFARSLAIPQELDAAVAAFADGKVTAVDLASANGRLYVHQFSVGLHPKLITLREEGDYSSRIGKIWGSVRAAVVAFFNPPLLRATLTIDDQRLSIRTPSLGISNNLFGEGHLPYADALNEGLLGVYITRARRKRELARAMAGMALGRWKTNAHVDVHQARKVTLTVASASRRLGCAIDGELCPLEDVVELRTHPAALKVLVPS